MGVSYMLVLYGQNKDKTTQAFAEFSHAVSAKKAKVLKDSYETCVDGRKVVIVNGTTYYAGKVDTWGDVETIMCD